MAKKYYIAVLLKTGATVRECLLNAYMSEEQADVVMRDPKAQSGKEFRIHKPGISHLEVIVSPLKDGPGWGLWRAYVGLLFDTQDEAVAHGMKLMRELVESDGKPPLKFGVLQMKAKDVRKRLH